MRVRPSLLVVHRWVGLVMAAFLIVAGATGSLMAFYADLDGALNPELLRASPPAPGAPLLDPIELHGRVRAQLPPETRLDGVILDLRPARSANYWIDERETFVDPYTGRIKGSRKFGDLGEGKKNLLTFIYRLHYSLALGEVGTVIFGVVALLWTIDCFVGAYLTLPPRAIRAGQRRTPRRWLARWLPSWLLRSKRLFALVFTWHRASGLWVWGALLVFAWSAVALNLGDEVYRPVMNLVLADAEPPEPDRADAGEKTAQQPPPGLDLGAARARGRHLMAAEADARAFRVIREKSLDYDPKRRAYSYVVESTLDVDDRLAETTISFGGDDGQRRKFHAPTDQSARGTFDSWLIALHFGAIRALGVAYRVFVSALGVLVVLLSVTGVWIWLRRRRRRGNR